MTCNVILTPQNGRFLAYIAGLPDCKAQADSRDKVLALIQARLKEIIKRSEIVKLRISHFGQKSEKLEPTEKRNGPAKIAKLPNLVRVDAPIAADDKTVHLETPWEYAGIFKNDPTLWPMMEEIERQRDRQIVYPKKKKRKK